MGRKKISIPKQTLTRLYHGKNYTPKRIGELYNCDAVTVRTRLKEFDIPLKTPAFARIRSARKNFNGTDLDKAYLIGFRIGDLNVYLPSEHSETIVIRSHSTIPEQTKLVQNLFCSYGRVTTSFRKDKPNQTVNCFLNASFNFLLSKDFNEFSPWLRQSPKRFCAFAAGYIDAEATFGVYDKRARFKVDSYDRSILREMFRFFKAQDINIKFYPIVKKGDIKYGQKWNGTVWRLSVNEKNSLKKFISFVYPFLRHKNRILQANRAVMNLKNRTI